MNLFDVLDASFSMRLAVTLLHLLWQGLAVGLFVALSTYCLRGATANLRYRINVVGLLVFVACFPVTFLVVGEQNIGPAINVIPVNLPIVGVNSSQEHTAEFSPQPPISEEYSLKSSHADLPATVDSNFPSTENGRSTTLENPPVAASETSASISSIHAILKPAAPYAIAIYLLGVLLMLCRLMKALWGGQRLRREAIPIEDDSLLAMIARQTEQFQLKTAPAVAYCASLHVPVVVGLFKPMILLPTSLATGLTMDQIEALFVHELAHIRRYDLVVNLLQRFIEAVLFFHPAVWYISRQVSIERENACDDLVVSAGWQRISYANALVGMAELCSAAKRKLEENQTGLLAASGANQSQFKKRILRLLETDPTPRLRLTRSGILLSLLLLTSLAFAPAIIQSYAQQKREKNSGQNGNPRSKSQKETEQDHKEQDHKNVLPRLFQLNVVGPDGKPVPHVSVEIRTSPAPTAKQIRRGKFIRTATYGPFTETDKEGRLEIMLNEIPKRFNLSIKKPGYGPYWAGWSSQDHPDPIPNEFTAKLDSGWSVGGIVVDPDGNPVEGVKVDPSVEFKKRPDVTSQLGVGTRIKTDEKGAWRFDLVPDSMKEIFVTWSHPDFQPLSRMISRNTYEVKPDKEPVQRIELSSGLTVSGTVSDEEGQPIHGALVRLLNWNDIPGAKTDKQGRYSLKGCEAKISRIVVSAQGKALDMKKIFVASEMAPVNFTMKPGGKIRIRVVDEKGKGVPKAWVFLQHWRNERVHLAFGHLDKYTDENGIWECADAPLEEFTADIGRPGGMQLSEQVLIAGQKEYKEYVFSPPQALIISGLVVDAKTKRPIKKFRAIPGFREKTIPEKIYWHPTDGYEAINGKFRFRQTYERLAHLVRIEADGYKIAVSRDIKPNEGKVNLNFSLEPAKDITATVLTPEGKPAANAQIAIGGAGFHLRITNGMLPAMRTSALRLEASTDGKLRFPNRDKPFQVVILHPTGFAFLKSEKGTIPNQISLKRWARIEGTFRVGNKIAPHVRLEIRSSGSNVPGIWMEHKVTTNKDGKYIFERAFPGKGYIARYFALMMNEGPLEVTSSKRVPVKFVAGKTIKLDLGGTGRPVIGKLVLPNSTRNEKLKFWKLASLQMTTFAGKPLPQPIPPANIKTAEQRKAWWKQWSESDQGKVLISLSELRQQILSETPRYQFSVSQDGTFRIDNVPEGDYVINGAGITDYRFTVPPLKKEYMEQPFDLGELIIGGQNPAPKAKQMD